MGTTDTVNSKNYDSNVYINSTSATNRGTKIVKNGDSMDRNTFVRLLTAELSNQDPTNPQDSTAYVAQMAQFSSLEQMTNLNSTMSYMSAASLVGKNITMGVHDENNQPYSGVVTSVSRSGDNIKIDINTTDKEFAYSDVKNIDSVESLAGANSLVGKNVKINAFDDKGKQITGKVKSAYNTTDGIVVTTEITASDGTTQSYDVQFKNILGLVSTT